MGATGNVPCVLCVAAKFKEEVGNASCVDCPDHSDSAEGSSSCTCNSGYTREGGQSPLVCVGCEAGTYSRNGNCVQCERGSWSAVPSDVCIACGAGNYSIVLGAIAQNECTLCEAGKYSDMAISSGCTSCSPGTYADILGASVCLLCPADTYSSNVGMTSMSQCLNCTKNSGTNGIRGASSESSCTCHAGYSRQGSTCEFDGAITFASIAHTSTLRSTDVPEYNILTVTFVLNLGLAPGAQIQFSNLTGTLTPSGKLPLIGDISERLVYVEGVGEWQQSSGTLSLTLAQAQPAYTQLSVTIEVQNPNSGQPAPIPFITVQVPGLPTIQKTVAGQALLVCNSRFFGPSCSRECFATATAAIPGGELGGVRRHMDRPELYCVCGKNQWGNDCNITLVPITVRISVQPGEAVVQTLTGGGELDVPSGTDFGGKQVVADVYEFVPDMEMPEGQNHLQTAGPMLIMQPSPHEFCSNKTKYPTCSSACAPTVCVQLAINPVSMGKQAAVYTMNSSTGNWQALGGEVSATQVCVLTCHWSTFAVMAAPMTAASPSAFYGGGSMVSSGGGGGGGSRPPPPPPESLAMVPLAAKTGSPNLEAAVVLAMSANLFTRRSGPGNSSRLLFEQALAKAAGVGEADVVVVSSASLVSSTGLETTKIVSGKA